jgi:hypothetical protein
MVGTPTAQEGDCQTTSAFARATPTENVGVAKNPDATKLPNSSPPATVADSVM